MPDLTAVTALVEKIGAALSARDAAGARVPDGYVVVPLEPTDVMHKAGEEARRENTDIYFDGSEVAGEVVGPIWRAMLDAAPQPASDAVEAPPPVTPPLTVNDIRREAVNCCDHLKYPSGDTLFTIRESKLVEMFNALMATGLPRSVEAKPLPTEEEVARVAKTMYDRCSALQEMQFIMTWDSIPEATRYFWRELARTALLPDELRGGL